MIPWVYRFFQGLLFCIFKVWNRFEIIGSDHFPNSDSGFIIAANHTSFLDPPVLGGRIRRPIGFLARETLFSLPILGHLIKWLGALPIAGDSEFKSLRVVIRALKAGKSVVIFPEGTRTSFEENLEPQAGVAFLAYAAKVPVIPCYIEGTDKVWPRNKNTFWPKKIRVFIGKQVDLKPIDSDQDKPEQYTKAAKLIMNHIRALRPAVK